MLNIHTARSHLSKLTRGCHCMAPLLPIQGRNKIINTFLPLPEVCIIFRFALSKTGLLNDNYSVKLKLTYHIPEFLPIFGKKARIYYHGMPLFCGGCHQLGHLKADCRREQIDWWTFIESLRKAKIPSEYFGTWIESNYAPNHSNRPAVNNHPQAAATETPKPPETPSGPESALNPAVVDYLRKLATEAFNQTPPIPNTSSVVTEKFKKSKKSKKPKKSKKKKAKESESSSSSSSDTESDPPQKSQFKPRGGYRGKRPFRGGRGKK